MSVPRTRPLDDLVDFREGDALQTLADIDKPIDFLFLDGWKGLYLPVLKLLEAKLRPGALILADDLDIFPELMAPYLEYVPPPGTWLRVGRNPHWRPPRALSKAGLTLVRRAVRGQVRNSGCCRATGNRHRVVATSRPMCRDNPHSPSP